MSTISSSNNPVIVFINPAVQNYYFPHLPLGLAELSAYVQRAGFIVSAIDAWAEKSTDAELRDFFCLHQIPAVGITITSFTMPDAKRIAGIIKSASPATLVVAGGHHPSYDPENYLKFNPQFDCVIFGEGEETCVDWLSRLHDRQSWRHIKGLAYREDDSHIRTNPPRDPLPRLDDLPLPNFTGFPLEKYTPHAPYGRRKPYFNLISSRGCPYACTFCSKSVFGRHIRLKSAQRVVEEIDYVCGTYGAKEVHFYDDVFTINKERLAQICNMLLEKKRDVIWSCTTRVDLVDREMLALMKRAGCWLVTFGVESGSDAILGNIDKSYTTAQVRTAFTAARSVGLKINSFWMIGLPGDTPETIGETINFAQSLKPDALSWSILFSLPGSRIFDAERDPGKEHEVALYKGSLSPDALEGFRKKAVRETMLTPGYLLRTLFSIRSGNELWNIIRAGLHLIRNALRRN
jgi:anaerobic magnesium-protoporphyrin IX monomethyl ester cyclase